MRPLKLGAMLALIALGIAAVVVGISKSTPEIDSADAIKECLTDDINSLDIEQLKPIIEACSRALQSKVLSPTQRAHLRENRGVAYRNAKKLELSLKDLRQARELSPDDPGIHRMLAWTLRGMQRHEEAEVEYDRALALDPHPQGYLSRCVVRFDRENYEKALADCETAHRMQATEDSYYFIGKLYIRLSRDEAAVKLFEDAIRAKLASGRIYGELSRQYRQMGRGDHARYVEDEGRQAFPNDRMLSLPPPPPKAE